MEPLEYESSTETDKELYFQYDASFATYAYTFDKSGNVDEGNRTEWSYGRFGRFQGYGSSFNYTFNNDTWKSGSVRRKTRRIKTRRSQKMETEKILKVRKMELRPRK